jgi:hypothetical protein
LQALQWRKVFVWCGIFLLVFVVGVFALIQSYALSVSRAQCFINVEEIYSRSNLTETQLRSEIDEVMVPSDPSNHLNCRDLGFKEVRFDVSDGRVVGTYRLNRRFKNFQISLKR